jgi:FtsZ-binding cell division protein ZapB
MIEQDTIKLLRECDAGIKMGIASIDDVTDKVQNEKLRECLRTCRDKHVTLQDEIRSLLGEYHDEGKEPNPMAKSMSWMKTNVKIAMDESDHTIADLMTDGCNMGIKSLRKYLNQYEAASEKAKDIAKRLINLEEKLVTDIKEYL